MGTRRAGLYEAVLQEQAMVERYSSLPAIYIDQQSWPGLWEGLPWKSLSPASQPTFSTFPPQEDLEGLYEGLHRTSARQPPPPLPDRHKGSAQSRVLLSLGT